MNKMTPTVREAEEKDVGTLYELILELSSHENSQEYIVTNPDKLREQGFGKDKLFGALLAECDGKIAGYLTYVWNFSTWQGGYYMYLENIFVLKHYRSLGVGAALLQEAKNVCNHNGRLHIKWEVQLDNEKAIEFYKRQGATVSPRGIGSCKAR